MVFFELIRYECQGVRVDCFDVRFDCAAEKSTRNIIRSDNRVRRSLLGVVVDEAREYRFVAPESAAPRRRRLF